jgi:hypothetical protein
VNYQPITLIVRRDFEGETVKAVAATKEIAQQEVARLNEQASEGVVYVSLASRALGFEVETKYVWMDKDGEVKQVRGFNTQAQRLVGAWFSVRDLSQFDRASSRQSARCPPPAKG